MSLQTSGIQEACKQEQFTGENKAQIKNTIYFFLKTGELLEDRNCIVHPLCLSHSPSGGHFNERGLRNTCVWREHQPNRMGFSTFKF